MKISISHPQNRPENPEISIIIPSYQHGRDIGRCLTGLFLQTRKNFEVIVVDDGSTDETQEVMKSWLDRVTLITKENGGGSQSAQVARNMGFKESRGKYVIFCDADVVMKPDCLEKMRRALDEHPEASYAYSSFRLGWKTFGSWQFDAETLRQMNFIHTSSLIRREHFPGFDETVPKFQDWDLWLTMLEAGHVGVWIPETLFMCIPHGKWAMSVWVPRFFYRIPWRRLGWRMIPVEKYHAAEARIVEKHRLGEAEKRKSGKAEIGDVGRFFWITLLAFLLVEILSYVGYRVPLFGNLVYGLVVAGMAVLAWWRLPVAMLVVAAELLVGSQGGALFSISAAGFPVALSLRLGLFAAVWLGFVARMLHCLHAGAAAQERAFGWLATMRRSGIWWPFIALLVCFAAAFVRGFWLGNKPTEILLDANGYAFFLLLPLTAAVVFDPTLRRFLPAVFSASVVAVTMKALLVLYIHSHRMVDLMRPVYSWVRDTRIGEITRMGETDFYRIFFQSQLFAMLAVLGTLLWLAYGLTRRDGGTRRNAVLLTLMMVSVVLGLSRSFWFGGVIAGMLMVGWMVWTRAEWVVWRRMIGYGAASLLAACGLILGAYAFPLPYGTGNISLADLLSDRATSLDDAAANSRWALLPVLTETGREQALLGSGFGKTVTYQTSDPRILAYNPSGMYTTAAFEWGWLDLWIKLGVPGLLAYVWLLWILARPHWQTVWSLRSRLSFFAIGDAEKRRAVLSFGTLLALVTLASIHVFSPYLGHPLGIGAMALIWALGVREEKKAS